MMFIHEGSVSVTGGDHQERLKHTIFNDRGFYFGEESDRNYSAESFCVIWAVDSRALINNFESSFPSRSWSGIESKPLFKLKIQSLNHWSYFLNYLSGYS